MSSLPPLNELFERSITYPDFEPQERLEKLIGLNDYKKRLAKMLGLLVNPSGLNTWIQTHHPEATNILSSVLRRPPLVVLAGDVGSGKSELAETIGDRVARQEGIDITLFPLSLSARGQGRVGEMTKLISSAFDHTVSEAKKLKSGSGKSRGGIILLIDEADALAQSRESSQMHHEDRAGVNSFIRGIDRIANERLPVAVIMCTNRINALDPAIKRRAADIMKFSRPDESQRLAVLSSSLSQLGLSEEQILPIVKATGPNSTRAYGFTFSDLTQRLIPSIVLDAYPDKPINAARAQELAREIDATPPFQEEGQ